MSGEEPRRGIRGWIAAVAAIAVFMVAPAASADGLYLEPLPGDGGVDTVLLGLGNTYRCPTNPACPNHRQTGSGGTGPNHGHPRGHPAPKLATVSERARLRFTPDPAVKASDEQIAVQQLVQDFGGSVDPTAVAQAYQQAVSSWNHGLTQQPERWRLDNLGDIATYTLLQDYLVYNNAHSTLTNAGDQIVRAELQNALAIHSGIRQLSSAAKQRAGDALQFDSIYDHVNISARRQFGDPALISEAVAGLRSWVKRIYGIDLAKVKITAHGLVSR